MTRAAWERTITDSAGNVLTGVQIAVFQQDGITPATIYGQLSGGAALSNPFNTGVQTSAKFYADPGRYVIRAVKDGNTKEFTDVDIADKAIRDDVGTAAYLTATTSEADRTAGRALRVGDHGIGVTFRGRVDVLAGQTPAQVASIYGSDYVYGGAILNHGGAAPTPFGILSGYITANNSYSYTYQDFTDLYGGKWTRTAQVGGAAWNPWTINYAGNNAVGPVSFSDGASTGAIIERGANANGDFTKFADGTVIAWGTVTLTGLSINPAFNNNSNTGVILQPTMPTVLSGTVSITKAACYTTTNSLIYSALWTGDGGSTFLINTGQRPADQWPRLDQAGTFVGTKVVYEWVAVGRWR